MRPALLLEVSRPGLWFPTVWLYGVPLGQRVALADWRFWLGLCFVTFPLNFVVYGWNDARDADTDALNPRKGTYLFGARPDAGERAVLPRLIALVVAASFAPLIVVAGWPMALTLAAVLLCSWAYNEPWGGLKRHPPWDLIAPLGYLLVVPSSALVNDAPLPSLSVWAYLALFAVQAHLIGEVMDIEPDRAAGRHTTATALGLRGAKRLILGIVAVELGIAAAWIGDAPLAAMQGAAFCWLLLDYFLLYRNRSYTVQEMRLAGLGSNALAALSAAYVWWSGCLVG